MIGQPGPEKHWYGRFGIEPPFPWVLAAMFAGVLLAVIGVSVVIWHH